LVRHIVQAPFVLPPLQLGISRQITVLCLQVAQPLQQCVLHFAGTLQQSAGSAPTGPPALWNPDSPGYGTQNTLLDTAGINTVSSFFITPCETLASFKNRW